MKTLPIAAAVLLVLAYRPGADAAVLLDDAQLDAVAAGVVLSGNAASLANAAAAGSGDLAITTATTATTAAYVNGTRQWISASSGAQSSASSR